MVAETPGFLDGEALLLCPAPTFDPLLGCKIDVKSAFKRILHPSEFPLAIFTVGGVRYFSKSCIMGVRVSPFHWCRLNGRIPRLTKRLLPVYLHGSIMYVGDSLFCSSAVCLFSGVLYPSGISLHTRNSHFLEKSRG